MHFNEITINSSIYEKEGIKCKVTVAWNVVVTLERIYKMAAKLFDCRGNSEVMKHKPVLKPIK